MGCFRVARKRRRVLGSNPIQVPAVQPTQSQSQVIAKGVSPDNRNSTTDETRVSDFVGTEIVSEKGESFGVVKDLIISRSKGSVEYVIVSSDNGDFRAIPLEHIGVLSRKRTEGSLLHSGNGERSLSKGSYYSSERMDQLSTPTWTTYVPQVRNYYSNVRPVTPGEVRRERRQERRNAP